MIERELGITLRRLREERDLSQKEVLTAVEPEYGVCDGTTLRRYEKGVMRPPKRLLLLMLTKAFGVRDSARVGRILRLAEYMLTPNDFAQYGLQATQVEPQRILWGANVHRPPGIVITSSTPEEFVPWSELKPELEAGLLNQLGRHIPAGCTLALDVFEERPDWLVRIVSPDAERIGDVWFGNNPDDDWNYDGFVRAGIAYAKYIAEVWQVFQRYSDGSYRRIGASRSAGRHR